MMSKIKDIFQNHPCFILGSVAAISFAALAAAFASEAFLGLEPCIMCIYQRWPYAIVIALGVIGLGVKKLRRPAVLLSGLTFLVNSGLATYHTGIEQKWWASQVEGCSVPTNFGTQDTNQSILENIMSAPTGNCAEIPWQDPIIGLSMANYNIALCFVLFVICVISFAASRKKAS